MYKLTNYLTIIRNRIQQLRTDFLIGKRCILRMIAAPEFLVSLKKRENLPDFFFTVGVVYLSSRSAL